MLDIEIISDEKGFDDLETVWDPLLAQSASDTLFLSFVWMRTWWKYFGAGGDLCILVFVEGSEPVGIAPLFRSRQVFGDIEKDMIGDLSMILPTGRAGGLFELDQLAFLGTGSVCSDYLDVFCKRGRERDVADSLLEYLPGTLKGWDLLNLSDMPSDSPFTSALADRMGRSGKFLMRDRYRAPCAPLGASYEDYLGTLSRKSRYNARKKLKEIRVRHEAQLVFHDSPEGLDEKMDVFIRLHQNRWSDEGLPGVFTTPEFIGFHKEMAAAGLKREWLRLGFLRIDGEDAFALYAYRYGDRIYLYQQGSSSDYGSLNLGYAALALAVEAAIGEGCEEYDFLRGDAAYKTHWARRHRQLIQAMILRGSLRSLLFRMHRYFNTDPSFRRVVKRLIPGKGKGA